MKRIFPSFARIALPLALLQLGLLLGPALRAAVGFTLTPAAVSNTYSGAITLQVTGLTNNETVVVQKYLDLNTNGVVDAADWPVQQFSLTDGQAGMVLGGVTNFNIPGDTDTAPGQITAALIFQNGDFMQNVIGQYLYVVSSPSGHFTPITHLFAVTNAPSAQKFTGNVVITGTSTTVPNAVVFLFPSGGHHTPLAGAVANNSGSYTLPAPPGSYGLAAFKSSYVVNASTLPVLTLGSSQTLTTNLAVTSATGSISGMLVDAGNPSLGLPGILLSAQAANGLMGLGFTDTNGNFAVGVATNIGLCSFNVNGTSLIVHGYVAWNNDTNINAGATGVTLACPKATALFYGNVQDNLGNPIPGMDVEAYDNNNLYGPDAYSFTNGQYVVGVLGGLNNDPWQVDISSKTSLANYLFSQPDFDQNGGTNLSANTAVQVNFTAALATNTISGTLKDNSGNPIGGVWVWANATINGVNYNQGVDTDPNGNYSLNVLNGAWQVGVSTGGSDGLPANYICPASQSVVIANNNGTANFIAILAANTISGTLKDSSGNPIAGVWVWANATINGVNYNPGNSTDANGNYSFGVLNGAWQVGVNTGGGGSSLPANYVCTASQSVVIANNNATVNFIAILAAHHISGTLTDNNGNPIGGVGVWANATINGVNYSQGAGTDANGNYSFGVLNGTWQVGVNTGGGGNSLPANYLSPSVQWVVILNNNGLANFTAQANINVGGPLQVTTGVLPSGAVGAAYDQQLTADGGTPNSSYSWSVVSGSLPPGLSMDGGGTIQGTPTLTNTYNFTAQVSDNNGHTATRILALTINNAPLQVTTASLSSGTTNVAYNSQQLTAGGGSPPYLWSLASGALPPGLGLSTNGVISGTPTTAGTSNFVVRVTDSVSATATQALSLAVYAFSTSVTFNVTPSAISNFYTGIITVQVGGLLTGETVLVENFRDKNGNGVIDATDAEVKQFQLTDGQASVFYDGTTAVTNFNVPGDLTPADGAITAQLNLALSDSAQLDAAHYAFRLSSPTGRFAPITNLFNVTNSAYPQSFTGYVVCSGTNVPHALVYLLAPSAMTVIAGAQADAAGAYHLNAPPGTYLLWAFKSGFVGDTANSPVLALGANATITTNLSLLPATSSISGRVVDAANTNAGLPCVILLAATQNGLVVLAFTDGDGYFALPATANWWAVYGQYLDSQGLLALQSPTIVNATAGSVAGLTIALARGTALVYGAVQDAQGHPLSGVRLSASQNDGAGPYVGDATTGQNGNYAMAVNDAGVWNAAISGNNPAFPNYVWSAGLGDTALSQGQAVQCNFTGLLATNFITGTVKDSNNNPIAGVGVWASATINGVSFDAYVDTDTNGNYSLNAGNGSWTVGLNASDGNDCLDNILGSGNYTCPNNQSVSIANNNGAASFTVSLNLAPLQVNTTWLPNGTNGAFYTYTLQASGGRPPYLWSIPDYSAGPPPNLTLATNGVLSGTPATNGGPSYFDVAVTDAAAATAYQTLSLTVVNPPLPPLQITNVSLPGGTVGAPYSAQLGATGGQPPYYWSLALGSAGLPAGLALDSSGLISGTPTTNKVSTFKVQATDANYATTNHVFSITINPCPSLGSPGWLGNQFQMRIIGATSQVYTVLMSTNLSSTNWTPLFATNSATTSSFNVTDGNATNSARFYRVKVGP